MIKKIHIGTARNGVLLDSIEVLLSEKFGDGEHIHHSPKLQRLKTGVEDQRRSRQQK
jgi:hypothetical protein